MGTLCLGVGTGDAGTEQEQGIGLGSSKGLKGIRELHPWISCTSGCWKEAAGLRSQYFLRVLNSDVSHWWWKSVMIRLIAIYRPDRAASLGTAGKRNVVLEGFGGAVKEGTGAELCRAWS